LDLKIALTPPNLLPELKLALTQSKLFIGFKDRTEAVYSLLLNLKFAVCQRHSLNDLLDLKIALTPPNLLPELKLALTQSKVLTQKVREAWWSSG